MTDIITDSLSRSVQDYLKTIYALTRGGAPIGTVELSESMSVAPASVSNMLQKLDQHQPPLVEYQKHRGVMLTVEGEQAALRVIRRHRLLEQFLVQILGYTWDMVHKDAEELEHDISPYMENRIAEVLGEPRFDPHGEPIPNRALQMLEDPYVIPLGELEEGQTGLVRQLDGRREDLFDFFIQIGLGIGSHIRVQQRNSLDGTLRITVDNQGGSHVIGPGIGRAILVSHEE